MLHLAKSKGWDLAEHHFGNVLTCRNQNYAQNSLTFFSNSLLLQGNCGRVGSEVGVISCPRLGAYRL